MKRVYKMIACFLAITFLIGSFSACASKAHLEAIQFKKLNWAVGAPLPAAADFAIDLPEGYTVEYAEEYSFSQIGDYELDVIVADAKGKKLKRTVQFSLCLDTEPPVISGVQENLLAYIGKSISYKSGVSVSDNCDGEVSFYVDNSAVNPNVEGAYPVRYVATDAAGNTAVVSATVHVYQLEITDAELNRRLDAILSGIITSGMSAVEKCHAVHRYVMSNVHYRNDGEKVDWKRSAYFGIETNSGDCFTYYALSRALLERLGFETMCIERSAEARSKRVDGTHFWNYVNIGTANEPAWYHFDTTPLRNDPYSGKFCLVTDEQLSYYNEVIRTESNLSNQRKTFYTYDKTGYPTSATRIVTSLPLDQYLNHSYS